MKTTVQRDIPISTYVIHSSDEALDNELFELIRIMHFACRMQNGARFYQQRLL